MNIAEMEKTAGDRNEVYDSLWGFGPFFLINGSKPQSRTLDTKTE